MSQGGGEVDGRCTYLKLVHICVVYRKDFVVGNCFAEVQRGSPVASEGRVVLFGDVGLEFLYKLCAGLEGGEA
jgi:hypothetical protein